MIQRIKIFLNLALLMLLLLSVSGSTMSAGFVGVTVESLSEELDEEENVRHNVEENFSKSISGGNGSDNYVATGLAPTFLRLFIQLGQPTIHTADLNVSRPILPFYIRYCSLKLCA